MAFAAVDANNDGTIDRDEAARMHREMGITDHSDRTLYLMGGRDLHGGNDFRMRL